MELDNVMHVGILFAGPWIQLDDVEKKILLRT